MGQEIPRRGDREPRKDVPTSRDGAARRPRLRAKLVAIVVLAVVAIVDLVLIVGSIASGFTRDWVIPMIIVVFMPIPLLFFPVGVLIEEKMPQATGNEPPNRYLEGRGGL